MLDTLRTKRWATLCVVNLRILIGFAFLPAGLKKLLAEPFTDPAKAGRFHDFLDAFHATGAFYQFVGLTQLVTATLLITQRFAPLGALLAVPITATIAVFCWSTGAGIPTVTVITLMCLGSCGLLLWDLPRLRLIVPATEPRIANPGFAGVRSSAEGGAQVIANPGFAGVRSSAEGGAQVINMRLWQRCGVAIVALYFGTCAAMGGVYRPKGMELSEPAFYVMPVILLLPILTLVIDQRRSRGMAARVAS